MGPKRPDVLCLTLRRLSILAAYVIIVFDIVVPTARRLGATGVVDPMPMVLVLSPWALGFLVLLLDRRGPVKYWAVSLLVAMVAPLYVACHDWFVIRTWLRHGAVPGLFWTLAINLALLVAFAAYLVAMGPRRCPDCGRRALIPLLNFWGRPGRTPTTSWCGACGAKFWRLDRASDWKVERRRTWIDRAGASEGEGSEAGSPLPSASR